MPWIKVCIFPTPRLNPKSFDYFLFTRKKIFFYFFWYEWGTHVRLRWFLKWKSEWQWRRKLVSFIFPRATHNASKPRECGSPTMFFFFFFSFQGGWCSWLLAVKVGPIKPDLFSSYPNYDRWKFKFRKFLYSFPIKIILFFQIYI